MQMRAISLFFILSSIILFSFVSNTSHGTLRDDQSLNLLSKQSKFQTDYPAFTWWRLYGSHQTNGTAFSITPKSSRTLVFAGLSEVLSYDESSMDYSLVDNYGNWIIGYGYYYGGNTRGYSVTAISSGGFVVVGSANGTSDGFGVLCLRASNSGWDLWIERYSGPSDDEGYDIVECQSGGFAILGYTKSFGAGGSDMWLIRIDADGVPLWNRTYGGSADDVGTAIVECESGGFGIAGYTKSYGAGSEDMWLIRTDEGGNVIWDKTYGNGDSDFCYDLTSTQTGGFCLVGSINNTVTSIQEAAIINTDANGSQLWSYRYSADISDCARGIFECTDGGFATTGYTTQFLSGGISENLIVFRFDVSGLLQWIRTFGWESQETGYSLTQISTGDFVACGSTTSNGTLDHLLVGFPDTEPPAPPTFQNVFLITGIISAMLIIVIVVVFYFKAIRSSPRYKPK